MIPVYENLAVCTSSGTLSVLAGATVYVTSLATGLPAVLLADDEVTTIGSSVTTDTNGGFSFKVADGEYKLTFSHSSIATFSRNIVVENMIQAQPLTKGAAAGSGGAGLIGFIQSGIGAIVRTIMAKLRESKSFYDFGAVGDGVADDTAAVKAALADHLLTGVPLVTGAGRFKVSAQIAVDVTTLLTNTGICIRGAGRRRTILISTYSADVPFLVTGGNAFFHTLRDIGFEGNYAGPVLQVGKNDFSDAFNSSKLVGINVNNASTNAAAEGARLNYVLQSDIDIVANGSGSGRPTAGTAPGVGTAIVLRQVQFSKLMIAGGNANIGLRLTSGYIFGNTFEGLDLEEVNTGLQIDSANANRNTFAGGQIVATYCVNNTAGNSNILQSVNMSPYAGGAFVNGSNFVGTFLVNPGDSNVANKWTPFSTLSGTNAATLRTEGPDANIQGELYSKGLSGHVMFNSAGDRLFSVAGGASLKNYPELRAAAANGDVDYSAASSTDANVNIRFVPKGAGYLKTPLANIGNYASDAAAATGGVPVGGWYRNGSALQIRVS